MAAPMRRPPKGVTITPNLPYMPRPEALYVFLYLRLENPVWKRSGSAAVSVMISSLEKFIDVAPRLAPRYTISEMLAAKFTTQLYLMPFMLLANVWSKGPPTAILPDSLYMFSVVPIYSVGSLSAMSPMRPA